MKLHSQRLTRIVCLFVRADSGHILGTSLNVSPAPDSAPDTATELMEGFVFRPWFGLAFTGILCVLSLPFFAITLLIAAICSTAAAALSLFRGRRRFIDCDIRETWAVNEFGFERAIEAYEELIDAYAWRQP